jgi:hypothetical protein
MQWVSPSTVYSKTPAFCRFSFRYPNAQEQNGVELPENFQHLLEIQPWLAEKNLLAELQQFADLSRLDPTRNTGVESWESLCKYVFQALLSIKKAHMTKVTRRCFNNFELVQPEWIMSILRLKIFPVSRRDGSKGLMQLDKSIFVPNSPGLNSVLRGKVDLLDFNSGDIYSLVPLLEFGAAPVKYLLSYDNEADIEIPSDSSLHDQAMVLLQAAKPFIARYFYNNQANITVDLFTIRTPYISTAFVSFKQNGAV